MKPPNPCSWRVCLTALLLPLASAWAQQAPPVPPPPLLSAPPTPPPPPHMAPDTTATPAIDPAEPVIPDGLSPEDRDPFWPVGYRPKPPEEIQAEIEHIVEDTPKFPPPKWKEARETLRLGGYSRVGTDFTAYVNNTFVSRGDIVTTRFEGKDYRWIVDAIGSRSVSFRPLDFKELESANPAPKERPAP